MYPRQLLKGNNGSNKSVGPFAEEQRWYTPDSGLMQDRTGLCRATRHLSDPNRDCEVLSFVHSHWEMFCYGVSLAHERNTFCLLSWAAVYLWTCCMDFGCRLQ